MQLLHMSGVRDALPRSIRLAAAIVVGYVVAAYVTNVSIPITIRAEAALVLVVTAFRPALGLMLVAAVAPLGDIIVPLLGSRPTMHADTLVLAFLSAWLAKGVAGAERPRCSNRLANAMWVFSCVVIASVATTALQLYEQSPQQLHDAAIGVAQSYLAAGLDPLGVRTAATLLQGIALIAAVVELAGERHLQYWLPRILVVSIVVTSVASGLLAIGIAPATMIARQATVALPRYAAAMKDVNAAASCYLLLLGVSVGLAASGGRARWAWWLASIVIVGGVGLAGSRAALVAVAVVPCAAAALGIAGARQRGTKFVVGAVVAVGIIGALAVALAPSARRSLDMRAGFTRASLHMIEARPVFGVGTGRYYPLSSVVLPPSLAWFYGQENAHDYLLQTTAEIGIVGAIVSMWMLASILIGPIGRLRWRSIHWLSAGAIAGTLAYLVTALTGQPFLVPEAIIPFWIVLGLLAAESAAPATERMFPRLPAVAFGCIVLLTVPFRPGVPRIRLRAPEDGFTAWNTDEYGRPFRETRDFASVFVVPTVTLVEIPLRIASDNPADSVSVSLSVPGWSQHPVLVRHDWSTVLISLPADDVLLPSERINIAVFPIEAAASNRPGIYVGQIRIVTARQ